MKRFALASMVIALLACSCNKEAVYVEGPMEDSGAVGKMNPIPDATPLRELADGMQKYMLEFNFKSGISGQVNPLNDEETRYLLENRYEAGTPQINPQTIIPGKAEVVFFKGSIGVYDRISGKFSSFELSPDLIPPMELQAKNNRPLTKELVEKIARLWFGQIGIDIANYSANPYEVMEPTTVVFQETLKDPDTKSPNYVKAIISHWGMVVRFDINIGPTPKVGTKPTFDEATIMDKAKSFLALPKDFNLDVNPIRVVKREVKESKGEVVYFDRLAWFIDASGYALEAKNQILTLDAHTGLPIQ